ncbi:helix-turn-helix domain-containing protein [Bacillus sp. 3255]|uniref:helix-turn-helix domain-containing protein n=1 Tax=Bacillus sp. 3255 TaxID=2817904 RepID=UPI00285A066A|nr:helix-turn-helix domain-containing protein [Bacillus sp. 3255]MDR6879448.1 AraC-like DNA-binding protein [Bacillus sp. 3255]
MVNLIQGAFSNFKFRSLFFRILFLLILLVVITVLIVGFFANRYSQNVVKTEVKQSSIQMLEQTRRLMDTLLNDVDQITVRLAQNRAFSEALEAGAEGPTQSDADEIRSYLLDSYITSPYIESMYVYYAASDTVQTSLIGPVKSMEMDDSAWLPYYRSMNRTEGKWLIREYPDEHKNLSETQVTFIRTTPWASSPIQGAIIVNMNQQALFQIPSFRLMRQGEEIWMVSPDATLAFNSNTGLEVPSEEFAAIQKKLGSDISAFTGPFRGSEYSFTAVSSPYTGWKYVDLIPTYSLYKSSKEIQSFMLILMAFSMLAAVLVAFYITLRIYSPIHSLVQMVNNKKGDWKSVVPVREQSELAMLFSAFISLKEHGAEMEGQLKDNWPVLQQSFLQQLIHERSKLHEERYAKFIYYQLPVTRCGFFVMVIRIDDYHTYVNQYGSFDQSLIRYFIAKLAGELGGHFYRSYPLHTESRDIILVCNPEESMTAEAFGQGALETAERIRDAIREYLHLTVSTGIGELKQQAGDISESYREAVDALESRVFKGYGLIAASWLVREKKPGDNLLIRKLAEHKREILLLFREEPSESFEEELQKLDEAARGAEGLPFPLIQHAYFQLIVEVFQRSTELGLPPQADNELAMLQEKLLRMETVDDVVKVTKMYIRHTSRRFHDEKRREPDTVAKQILDYIQINYDKEVSLGGIADQLQLDPSYVSRMFRQEISITFMDYVIYLRLEKAKELLKMSDLTVKDIGAAVGYANQRSFNRIFKKHEGMTPGEFRDIHAPKKLHTNEIY